MRAFKVTVSVLLAIRVLCELVMITDGKGLTVIVSVMISVSEDISIISVFLLSFEGANSSMISCVAELSTAQDVVRYTHTHNRAKRDKGNGEKLIVIMLSKLEWCNKF